MSHHWKASDLKNLRTNHIPSAGKKVKLPKIEKVSVEKRAIATVLFVLHREGVIPSYTQELQFHPTRKWRFDWAIPELKIGVEYEGLMSDKSGHTTVKGYTSDCQKYNAAQVLGWKVLRYTILNYSKLEADIKNLLKK